MKKIAGRIKCLICYILIISMILPTFQSMGTVNAASGSSGLSTKKVTILVGQKYKLTLSGDTIKSARSSKPKVAAVNNNGTVTGKKAGKTTITVTGKSGKKYKCKVTVKIGLSKGKVYVSKDGTVSVKMMGTTIKKATVKKNSIIRVSKNSKKLIINGLKKGSAKITVVGKNNKKYICTVIVEQPALSASEITIAKGDKQQISLNNTTQKVKWSSETEKRVTIDDNGNVTAVSAGNGYVKARDESGVFYYCKVCVEEPRIAASELTFFTGQSINLVLAGNTQKITWTSSDNKVATVDSAGVVKTLAAGTANITATVASGSSYSCKINVMERTNKADGDSEGNKPDDSAKKDNDVNAGTGDYSNVADDSEKYNPSGETADASDTTPSVVPSDDDPVNPADQKEQGDDIGGDDPQQKDDDTPDNEQEDFYVNFLDVEGGSSLKSQLIAKGTTIGDLPSPEYDDGRVFAGWYYDSDYTMLAAATDEITSDLILYAKSMTMGIQTPEEVVRTTAVNDVDTDYTIEIKSSDPSKTAEDILNVIEVSNVTHQGSDDYQLKGNNVEITGGNGTFTLRGKHLIIDELADGFEKGASYVIKLPELAENSNFELTFGDQPKSVRDYYVNTARKEVNNMELSSSVVTLALSELEGIYDNSGKDHSEIVDRSFYNVDAEGNTTESEGISGYFVLKGKRAEEVKVGSTVALYSGMDPAQAFSNPEAYDSGEDNHITYLFVNKVDGDKYYFGNADLTDIIKMPEVLPIASDADIGLDDRDDTYEIPVSELDWSDDKYMDIRLSSKTTLDVGDFIMLYKGEYGSEGMEQVGDYAEVLSVTEGGTYTDAVGDEREYVIIEVRKATLEDIANSGDTSYNRPIDVLDSLTDEQIEEIKEETIEDAKTSGFLEEAGQYLAKTAMATEGFKTLEGAESIEGLEDYDYVVKDSDGNVISQSQDFYNKYKDYSKNYKEMMETYKQFIDDDGDDDDGAVEVELEDISVNILQGEHLDGSLGVELGVVFSVEVTIPKFGGGDDDKKDDENKDDDNKDGDNKDDKKDDKKDDDKKDDDKKDDDKKDDDKKDDENEEADDENKLKIEISATFTQEIQLGMDFDAKIEWEKILGIPVPVDVLFVPSFTTGTYTGIGIEATCTTGSDDGFGNTIWEDQENIMTDITSELKELMETDSVEEDDEAEEISNWLAVKYQQMLEQEHDPVTLVEKSLYETKYELFPGIVEFGLELKFVVTVDLVVTLGAEFYNIQSKKNVYTIHVLKGKCTSETVELIPAELDFKFYVMGSLEIKVGFEVELSLELVEGILGKASLTVGVGVYLDMFGFYYYHINIKSGRKMVNSAGALYIEIGIYLEIGTGAQIGKNYKKIKGKIASWETTLLDLKFPLKSWGENEVPLDFATLQEDVDDIELHQYVKKFVIPDSYYEVTTMTMDEGEVGITTYEDECYGVELSNSWFVYDEENHSVELKDGFKGMKTSCVATLYYKNGYIPLSTAKMERTINITWDNYLDGYIINPYSEGGSYVAPTIGAVGANVTKPANPVKKGYIFDGWFTREKDDEDNVIEKPYVYPSVMPAQNTNIYAHWKPATDTPYTMKYYLEDPDISGTYRYDGKKVYRGTTDTTVATPVLAAGAYKSNLTDEQRAEYQKYELSDATKSEVTIAADGSSSVNVYYDVKRSKTTFTNGGRGSAPNIVLTNKYGENIYVPEISAKGYQLTGWKKSDGGNTVSIEDISADRGKIAVADGSDTTYVAQWELRTDILYRIEYYVQQLSGAYTVQAVDYGQGKAGDKITAAALRNRVVTSKVTAADGSEKEETGSADSLFRLTDKGAVIIDYDCMTVDGAVVDETTIKADGSTVVKVRYSRKKCTVTLAGSGDDDTSSLYTDYQVCAGAKMALPVPTKEGYTFLGYTDENGQLVPIAENTEFQVVVVNEDTTYRSKGFKPAAYKVTYDANGGTLTGAGEQSFTYGTESVLSAAPVRADYVFKGWKCNANGKIYEAEESVKNLTDVDGGVVNLTAVWEIQGYNVVYETDGGTIGDGVNPDRYVPGEAEVVLAYPVKVGYTFDGWYNGEEKVMSLPGKYKADLTLTARWIPDEGIPYIVNHYQQSADGTSTVLVMSESFTGKAGDEVTPEVKTYEGFNSPETQTVSIAGDGSTVVEYNYERRPHTLTIDIGEGTFDDENVPLEYTLNYGANIELPVPYMEGRVFAGWMPDGELSTVSIMPDRDIALTAIWSEDAASVTINHYKQDTEGNFSILAESEVITGADGAVVTPVVRTYEGFTSPEATEITLSAEETQTINLNYERNKYNVSWNLDGGEAANEYTSGEVFFEAAIVAPVPVRDNYSYTWDITPVGVMGMEDQAYKAVWTAEKHKVAFDAMGGALTGDIEKEVVAGEKYGTLPSATNEVAEFTGWFDAREGGNPVNEDTIVTALTDHVLYAGWEYEEAGITYEGLEDAENENPSKYKIGVETVIKAPVRSGYIFLGWSVDGSEELSKEYTISAGATEAITLTAKWEKITYTLSLYSYSGLYLVKNMESGADLSKVSLPKNSGYTLSGWKDLETDEIIDSLPATMPDRSMTLIAQWTENEYRANFENLNGAAMDPITWKMSDNSFIVPEPGSRTGYQFGGWYLDSAFDPETLIEKLNPVAYNVTLYAKWVPVTYKINLYFGEGRDSAGNDRDESDDNIYTYDETKAIKTAASLGLTRNGYEFKGWAVEEGGSVRFADGYTFTQGGHTLYDGEEIVSLIAVWEPVVYKIIYDETSIAIGAGGNYSGNATSYSIESADADLRDPVDIKEGYEFLGWFDMTSGEEIKINSIVNNDGENISTLKLNGESGDKKLRAKWAYAGEFSIALKSSKSATPKGVNGDDESVFTITRRLATGTSITKDKQRVYFRTVNGTAVGGTVVVKGNDGPEKNVESANNFKHVGSATTFAVFDENTKPYIMLDNEQKDGTINSDGSVAQVEFTVTKERAAIRFYGGEIPGARNGTFAHQYNYSGSNSRYYTAEIYRIESADGNVTGIYGTRSAKRTMIMPGSNVITTDSCYGNKSLTVGHNAHFNNSGHGGEGPVVFSSILDSELCYYLQQAGAVASLNIQVEADSDEDSLTWDNEYYLKYHIGNTVIQRWGGRWIDEDDGWQWCNVGTQNPMSWNDFAVGQATYDGDTGDEGSGGTDYWTRNHKFTLSVSDSVAPDQVGIAPAATTSYLKGDKVRFSVVYDEVIATATNPTINTSLLSKRMPVENVRYIDGAGTNVLVFEGTATKEFENTTWPGEGDEGASGTNEELLKIHPVNGGTIKDMKGN